MTVFMIREDEWAVKGEGRANIVFGYTGRRDEYLGTVLRVAKQRPPTTDAALNDLETNIWSCTPIAENTTRIDRSVDYIRTVIGPRLGMQYIDLGRIVDVPFSLCERFRIEPKGVLLLDTTQFAEAECRGVNGVGKILSVEIKPKCGFVPEVKTIHPSHGMKKHHSKFWLQQALKLKQGKICQRSDYNPLALFSGNIKKMQEQFLNLIKCPQNNLSVFLEGERLQSTEEGLRNWDVLNALKAGFDALPHYDDQFFPTLANLVATILQEEGILKKLLEVQCLDRSDIEGVYPVFCSLLDTLPVRPRTHSQPQSGKVDEMNNRLKGQLVMEYENAQHALLRRPMEEKLDLLRDWLISTTAKDCSIFITFQLVKKLSSAARQFMPEKSFPKLLPSGHAEFDFLYKVQIADLDLKPVTKIPYQFRLDGEILTAVEQQQQQQVQQQQPCYVEGRGIRTKVFCRNVES